jgi:hypothetical protein
MLQRFVHLQCVQFSSLLQVFVSYRSVPLASVEAAVVAVEVDVVVRI